MMEQESQEPMGSTARLADTLWVCHSCKVMREAAGVCGGCGLQPISFSRHPASVEDVPEVTRKKIITIETLDSLGDESGKLREVLLMSCITSGVIQEYRHMMNVHFRAVDYALEVLALEIRDEEKKRKEAIR